jgi:hypothetical protein
LLCKRLVREGTTGQMIKVNQFAIISGLDKAKQVHIAKVFYDAALVNSYFSVTDPGPGGTRASKV